MTGTSPCTRSFSWILGAETADAAAKVASQGALYGALALILGALAAFFAGRGAAVDPVLTRTAVASAPTQRRV